MPRGASEGISMNGGKPEGELVEKQEESSRVREGRGALFPLTLSGLVPPTPQAANPRRALSPKEQVFSLSWKPTPA